MQAAVVNEITGRFDVEEIDIDEPRGREVLVEVRAAGLCHSDMLVASIDRGRPLPLVCGHELAGVIAAVGPEVREFTPGDHVVGSEVRFCGHCEECLSGAVYRCLSVAELDRAPGGAPRLSRAGEPVAGFGLSAFAEYSICHENQLTRIRPEVPFPQAAVIGCAISTGIGAIINTARVRPGDTVAVIGLGGIGLNILQGAKLAGATTIIGIDIHPAKLELAAVFGATHVIDGGAEDSVARVREITGRGVHHSFEAIGRVETQRQTIEMTRVGGGAYLIGIPASPQPLEIAALPMLIGGQRKVQGVFMGSSNPRIDIPTYANLYLQGAIKLDELIAQEISLSSINEAYRLQEGGAIARSVITSFR